MNLQMDEQIKTERAILGTIILDNQLFEAADCWGLSLQHFQVEAHRKIFDAMWRIFAQGLPIDLVTLTEELRSSGHFDEIGGTPALTGLFENEFSVKDLRSNITLIRKSFWQKLTTPRLCSACAAKKVSEDA
jgi:replicative DNA helicase